jgi:hypothetical protein
MKLFKISSMVALAFLMGASLTSCSDANEYEDTDTDNPSWVSNYSKSQEISHPDALTATKWVRASGTKKNAYGEEVQGFVESLDFVKADSVIVKMSQGTTEGVWVDESNTEETPMYEYTYSAQTGKFEILRVVKDDKGNKTNSKILIGVAVNGKEEGITVVHYGDTPCQTYLTKE